MLRRHSPFAFRLGNTTAHRVASAAANHTASAYANSAPSKGPAWRQRRTPALRAALSLRSFSSSSQWLAETVKVPQMAESISEGTLKQWLKKPGDFVQADEEVATIETDKIDVSVNAPKSGTITETLAEEEDTVTVGQDLFKLEPGGAPSGGTNEGPKKMESKREVGGEPKPAGAFSVSEAKGKAEETLKKHELKPSARRMSQADQLVEKREPEPTRAEPKKEPARQPEARKDYTRKEEGNESTVAAEKPKPFDRTERRVKMNRMRVRISERLKQSQNTAASLTTFNEIDMSSLMEMRKAYKDDILKNRGIKLGYMSAFARAACLALKEIPAANASIEGEVPGDTIVYKDYVDLSVAVATPKGLVTPVVRNAESMSFLEIEEEIANLGKKARDGKLTLEDMAGGTFTISNGGVFGSLYGTPIINLPQTAVLGMHAIKETPVVRSGQIVIRPIMVVALTYDHRLLDGREAVTLLVRIKEYLEDPRKMLLA